METFFGSRDPNSNTNAMGSTTLVLGNNPSISQSQIVRYELCLVFLPFGFLGGLSPLAVPVLLPDHQHHLHLHDLAAGQSFCSTG